MNGILELEDNSQTDVSNRHRLEITKDQAKITGSLCIGCAILSVLFALLSSTFFSLAIFPYFVFLLLSAAFGVGAYGEIKAIGSGLTSSIFQLLSVVLFILAFLSIPGKTGYTLGLFFGLIETVIPIMLMVLALISKKVAPAKAIVPLAVPISLVVSYPLITTVGFLPGALVLPLSWAMVGLAAYRGRS